MKRKLSRSCPWRQWQRCLRPTALAAVLALLPLLAHAQTDEIQVYDASIAPQGVFNLTFHSNYTPDGLQTAAFPGGIVPNHSLNGGFEWAYGYKPWLELGLYLPLYSISTNEDATINGGKIRLLFVSPHADRRKFFYGMNFEFSLNALHWDPRRFTSEIRPIVGVHLGRWDLIYNPILDNNFAGGFAALDFAPCGRIAYHLSRKWAAAAEEYDDFGPLNAIRPGGQQFHEVWAVGDYYGKIFDVEFGVGAGLTAASDPVTLKFMVSRNL